MRQSDGTGAQINARRGWAMEWPTVVLGLVIFAGWGGVTWFHSSLPLWVIIPAGAWFIAWYKSFQHEVIHGHPTRIRAVNDACGWLPLSLWLPYRIYKRTHLQHHCDERLTDPMDDPETAYWTDEDWVRLGPIARALVLAQQTLIGRLIIGPAWIMGRLWAHALGELIRGDRRAWTDWAQHALGLVVVLIWVIAICGMPIWLYGAMVYGGISLLLVRSFAEHRAAALPEHRTAIVENAPLFGLLFLYNNLHVVHHDRPRVPWYRIPALYRQGRKAMIARNNGLLYDGYGDVFRRYAWRAHHTPLHSAALMTGTPPAAIPAAAPPRAPEGPVPL